MQYRRRLIGFIGSSQSRHFGFETRLHELENCQAGE